jgi:DNA-binding beta-propeller fold protein YncE
MKTKAITVAMATIAATISVAACSTSTPNAGPTTTAASKPVSTSSSAPAAGQATSCEVNPSSAPVPTAEEFKPVPADSRISVTMTGIPSGTVKPGDPLTEVDVTLCNNSPVDYPKIGVVFVLTRCSCSTSRIGLPQGTAERFDPATGAWIKLDHPVIGTGMDYIGGFTDVQELPKGKAVTLKYRVALDASMADGKGGVEATVVIPDDLVQIGRADLPFSVSKEPTTAPAPAPRQAVLPFTGLTYPSGVAVDAAGDVYLTDSGNHRVLKMAAGSNAQTVLPFTGLKTPSGVGVDGAGSVYVTDGPNNRVLKLAAGSTDQTVLPLTGLQYPNGLAVDTAGDVYVIDGENRQVVKFAAGSNDQTAMPSTVLNGPSEVAVDGAGNVYVVDSSGFGQLVKLEAS